MSETQAYQQLDIGSVPRVDAEIHAGSNNRGAERGASTRTGGPLWSRGNAFWGHALFDGRATMAHRLPNNSFAASTTRSGSNPNFR